MAHPKFEDLALQYVLADEGDQERAISEKAAAAIQESTNSRVAVGQWVASINRWIQPADDSSDDNFIARAKALEFLASTLGVLKQRDVSLKSDQIKLLVSFFGSLFSSDHRAGVTASAKALRHLITMASFQPTLGNDIIANVCKLGDDFKLQTPTTRLELYELFLGLLRDPAVANDLEYRHGDTCGFMTDMLDLCRNERDPLDLLKWFETLKIFLQSFSPSADVTSEVFKTFSAYFPISLRASATPSGITADDLKSAVRSCFAAHYRVASHAIPYLINKLDQGDAVTVAVKVDILQTLDACLVQYAHPKQSIVPFIDQIWSSLKYEVRNGEVPDTIKATLKVISSLTKRLDDNELRSFISSAWRDLVEDLSNPTYTVPAGRLLVAIAGAGPWSFGAITSQAVSHIQTTLRHTQSASHKQELVALLNSILAIRSHLVETIMNDTDTNEGSGLLKDELFGDSLFFEVYLPLWEEISGSQATAEQVGILKRVMGGLAALVGQRSSSAGSSHQLCSAATSEKIFGWLAGPSVIYPIEGKWLNESMVKSDADQDIRDAAVSALKDAVPLYPPAFQLLLQQYLLSIKAAYQEQVALHDLPMEIKLVATTLCEIGCTNMTGKILPLSNPVSLISVLLEGLLWMLSERASPKYWTAFICSIHLSILQALGSLSSKTPNPPRAEPQGIAKEWFSQFIKRVEDAGAPRVDLSNTGNRDMLVNALEELDADGTDVHRQLLAYSLSVVRQLYRRFTTLRSQVSETDGDQTYVGLSKDFEGRDGLSIEQDVCLHQLGLLAASVIRALSEDEQKSLELGVDAFTLFHNADAGIAAPLPGVNIVSPLDDFRTAPLSMGILQGIYPGVIGSGHHIAALKNICTVLTSFPLPCLDPTRAALDMILTILSNKLRLQDDDNSREQLQIQRDLKDILITKFWDSPARTDSYVAAAIRVFRSILCFLAGDVARFQSGAGDRNQLLEFVCDRAPSVPVVGRYLARSFEVLVSPKECLEKENHAVRKRLGGEWLYFKAVRPYLKDCFVGTATDKTATESRSVAVFAILKHLKYEQYASDINQIIRVGIRSLGHFESGVEMESCLSVLLEILEKDPEALKEHLATLVPGMAEVYETARRKPTQSIEFSGDLAIYKLATRERERILCRRFVLEFLQKLPRSYEEQYLVPYRQQLMRPLSVACGDSVREIRRAALMARKAWEGLA
ncbi:hypothetical protein AAE478_002476 [Parahypoxylon ruwenzoriense]